MEFALSIGGCLGALVLLRRGDKLEWLCSRGVEDGECEIVPVDNNGKVMPGLAGEWDGKQYIQIVIQYLDVPRTSRWKASCRIGER